MNLTRHNTLLFGLIPDLDLSHRFIKARSDGIHKITHCEPSDGLKLSGLLDPEVLFSFAVRA